MSQTPVSDRIRRVVETHLSPEHLAIRNDSRHHAGHFHRRNPFDGSSADESHLWMEVVSSAFEGVSRLERHRWVSRLVASVAGVHALSMTLRTPGEATRSGGSSQATHLL